MLLKIATTNNIHCINSVYNADVKIATLNSSVTKNRNTVDIIQINKNINALLL